MAVWYHAHCPDGFAAALACWERWKDRASYWPVQYGRPMPENVDQGTLIMMVDFSLSEPETRLLAARAHRLVVLDHHATSAWMEKAVVENALLLHSCQRAGCRMAWEFLHTTPCPSLLEYVEDRDLWRFAHGDATTEVAAGLRTVDWSFQVWHQYLYDTTDLRSRGRVALVVQQRNVARQAGNRQVIDFLGHVGVPVANATTDISETCQRMLDLHPGAPFVATYYDKQEPAGLIRVFSLRSGPEGVDVSEIARAHGGGGHRRAAGFAMPLQLGAES